MEALKKARLWLTCGVPGSGKSTWVQKHKSFFAEKSLVISRDEIRFSLLQKGDDYFSKEKEVWNEYITKAKKSLKENTDTILDATHLNEKSRGKILRALGNSLKDVEINIIVINSGLKRALEQNNLRTGLSLVPSDQIKRMYSSMTIPTIEEGFDNIYIYEEKDGKVKYEIVNKGE